RRGERDRRAGLGPGAARPGRAACAHLCRGARRARLQRARERAALPGRRSPPGRGRNLKLRLNLGRAAALLASGRLPPTERAAHVEPLPDLASLSDTELKELIDELTEEEQEISYRRRLLHGKIDILRSELVVRLQKSEGKSVLDHVDVD